MKVKKFAVIGILALVVIGCILASGCTSTTTQNTTTSTTTTTSTDDAVVGTWTLPNGTTVVFGNDFTGVMTTGDNETKFTWKKTTDGKYQVDNEKGEQVIWTLDNVKGTMTNAAGMVLSKQISDTSGTVGTGKKAIQFTSDPRTQAFKLSPTIVNKGDKLINNIIVENTQYLLKSPSDGVLEFGYSTSKEYLDDYKISLISSAPVYLDILGVTYPTNWTTGDLILGDDAELGDYVYVWCRIKDNDNYIPYCLLRLHYSQSS